MTGVFRGEPSALKTVWPCVGFRIEPGEGDKVLVEKLANRVRVAATARTDDAQSDHARLRQQLAATRERDNQLFAQARNAIEQGPEMTARHSPNTRLAPCHRGHNHRTTGQQVDVAGELARIMADNQPIAVGRIEDVDLSGFNDVQIDIGLAGAKDGFAIGVVVSRRQGLEDRDLRGR